jgi:superfamily II DNA or RNA helicase
MSETITIEKVNEVYFRVECDRSIAMEMHDNFAFEMPKAKFTPKYKAGIWDGIIRLFNPNGRLLPIGLYNDLVQFCDARNYFLQCKDSPDYGKVLQPNEVDPAELVKYIDSLEPVDPRGTPIEVRDYQYEAIFKAVKSGRRTIISPTGSGKSLIAYCISRYILDHFDVTQTEYVKFLIVVPTLQLVSQMKNDFECYSAVNGWSADDHVHMIPMDKTKDTDKPIVVSTWQSLQNLSPEWFRQFTGIIIDEVQSAKSDSLQAVLRNTSNARYRFGLTGSLDKSETHQTMIRAMIGPVIRVARTRDLIDRGQLSQIRIRSLLKIPDGVDNKGKKKTRRTTYQEEMALLVGHEGRNKFVKNLALATEGNTLILFNYVDLHGIPLYNMLKNNKQGRPVLLVHGKTELDDREKVGHTMRENRNAIAVASFGTFAAGINIPEIDNVILASPTKSVVRLLQSIGRGLRLSAGKEYFTLFDIGDRTILSKTSPNHTYNHFVERLKIYLEEQFEYKIQEIQIE